MKAGAIILDRFVVGSRAICFLGRIATGRHSLRMRVNTKIAPCLLLTRKLWTSYPRTANPYINLPRTILFFVLPQKHPFFFLFEIHRFLSFSTQLSFFSTVSESFSTACSFFSTVPESFSTRLFIFSTLPESFSTQDFVFSPVLHSFRTLFSFFRILSE
jgi:hypothetical protein